MKKFINAILSITSVIMLFYIIYDQKSKIERLEPVNKTLVHQYDSLKLRSDSIESELFIQHINQERYEYIIDRAAEEMNPDCKQQLERIMHETE
jgi:hypothetical protein